MKALSDMLFAEKQNITLVIFPLFNSYKLLFKQSSKFQKISLVKGKVH